MAAMALTRMLRVDREWVMSACERQPDIVTALATALCDAEELYSMRQRLQLIAMAGLLADGPQYVHAVVQAGLLPALVRLCSSTDRGGAACSADAGRQPGGHSMAAQRCAACQCTAGAGGAHSAATAGARRPGGQRAACMCMSCCATCGAAAWPWHPGCRRQVPLQQQRRPWRAGSGRRQQQQQQRTRRTSRQPLQWMLLASCACG